MRKCIVFSLVLATSFFICVSSYAGGAGNCTQPVRKTTEYLGVGGAFEFNYVDKRLNELENKRGPRSMKVKKLSQIYGKGIIGLGDYVNLYGKIGSADYDLEFVDEPQNATMVIDLDPGIYTGGGLNALFPITKVETISFGIGFDIQANFYMNDVKGITRSGESAKNPSGRFYAVDGQNSLYLTCQYDIETMKTSIVPYIGGYHSWMVVGTQKGLYYTTPRAGYIDKEHYQAAFDFASFGLLIGMDLDIAKFVNLNIEGRFVGETAITTGATIKF